MKRFTTNTLAFMVTIGLLNACSGGNETPTVTEGNQPPSVTILLDSPHLMSANQSLLLEGEASDPEDGELNSDIEWRSSLDGVLGSGSPLTVNLSNGEHTLYALVTDSNGVNSEDSVSVIVGSAYGVATVSWVAPTENTDGTPITDLTGFVVHYGQSADRLDQRLVITDPEIYSTVVTNLSTETRYYFAVTAMNSLSLESGLSTIVSKYIEE